MMYLLRVLHSIVSLITITLLFVIHVVGCMLMTLCFRDAKRYNVRFARILLPVLFFVARIRYDVHGQSHIAGPGPYIFMSNHQSLLDIVALVLSVPIPFLFLTKKELKYVPLLGASIILQGHFSVDRVRARDGFKLIERMTEKLLLGWSILIFPEGTRSVDGTLGEFKRGSFRLPVLAQVPVIPCYIHGIYNLLPKKSLMVRPGKISISFGAPIFPPKVNPEDPQSIRIGSDALKTEVYTTIQSLQDQS